MIYPWDERQVKHKIIRMHNYTVRQILKRTKAIQTPLNTCMHACLVASVMSDFLRPHGYTFS